MHKRVSPLLRLLPSSSSLFLPCLYRPFQMAHKLRYRISNDSCSPAVHQFGLASQQCRLFFSTAATLKGNDGNCDHTNNNNNQIGKEEESIFTRVKAFLKKYGLLGACVYYSVSIGCIFSIYLLLKAGVDLSDLQKLVGLSDNKEEGGEEEDQRIKSKAQKSEFEAEIMRYLHLDINNPNTPYIVMAVILNKFLLPFRFALSVFITPRLHRTLLRFRNRK